MAMAFWAIALFLAFGQPVQARTKCETYVTERTLTQQEITAALQNPVNSDVLIWSQALDLKGIPYQMIRSEVNVPETTLVALRLLPHPNSSLGRLAQTRARRDGHLVIDLHQLTQTGARGLWDWVDNRITVGQHHMQDPALVSTMVHEIWHAEVSENVENIFDTIFGKFASSSNEANKEVGLNYSEIATYSNQAFHELQRQTRLRRLVDFLDDLLDVRQIPQMSISEVIALALQNRRAELRNRIRELESSNASNLLQRSWKQLALKVARRRLDQFERGLSGPPSEAQRHAALLRRHQEAVRDLQEHRISDWRSYLSLSDNEIRQRQALIRQELRAGSTHNRLRSNFYVQLGNHIFGLAEAAPQLASLRNELSRNGHQFYSKDNANNANNAHYARLNSSREPIGAHVMITTPPDDPSVMVLSFVFPLNDTHEFLVTRKVQLPLELQGRTAQDLTQNRDDRAFVHFAILRDAERLGELSQLNASLQNLWNDFEASVHGDPESAPVFHTLSQLKKAVNRAYIQSKKSPSIYEQFQQTRSP